MRTVGADGSYANGNAMYYMPYGEKVTLASSAASSLEGLGTWQGQTYDEATADYVFQYRGFDPELAVWLRPDPAGQFANPYGFGGDPVNYVDEDGRVVVWASGIGNFDYKDVFLDQYCKDHPELCGDNPHAQQSYSYWDDQNDWKMVLRDGTIAVLPVLSAFRSGNAFHNINAAYHQSQRDGSGVHVLAHSGGASTSGYATGAVNLVHGFGAVDDRTTVAGWDYANIGYSFSAVTDTRTERYYNTEDGISYLAMQNDVLSIHTTAFNTQGYFDAFSMDHWCYGQGHGNANPDCETVDDKLRDYWAYRRVAAPVGATFRGVTKAYDDYMDNSYRPWHSVPREYSYWKQFDFKEPGDYVNAGYRYSGLKTVHDSGKDLWNGIKSWWE